MYHKLVYTQLDLRAMSSFSAFHLFPHHSKFQHSFKDSIMVSLNHVITHPAIRPGSSVRSFRGCVIAGKQLLLATVDNSFF